MKKYKLSILKLASAVLGGVGATYLSAEGEWSHLQLRLKTEVVTPATTTNKNEVTPVGTETTNPKATAQKKLKHWRGTGWKSSKVLLAGKEVVINNVVVTKIDEGKGFYVQDKVSDNNPRTSDAVYVASKDKVESGDLLKVQGTVKEGYMEEYSVNQVKLLKNQQEV